MKCGITRRKEGGKSHDVTGWPGGQRVSLNACDPVGTGRSCSSFFRITELLSSIKYMNRGIFHCMTSQSVDDHCFKQLTKKYDLFARHKADKRRAGVGIRVRVRVRVSVKSMFLVFFFGFPPITLKPEVGHAKLQHFYTLSSGNPWMGSSRLRC